MLYVLALNRFVRSKLSCDVIFHTYSAFWTTFSSAFAIFPLLNASRCTLVRADCALHLVTFVCVLGDYEEKVGGEYSRDIYVQLLSSLCARFSLRSCIAILNKYFIVSCTYLYFCMRFEDYLVFPSPCQGKNSIPCTFSRFLAFPTRTSVFLPN